MGETTGKHPVAQEREKEKERKVPSEPIVRSDSENESSEPQPARLAKAPENLGKPPEQEPIVIVFPLAGKSEHPLTAIDLAELSKWKLTQPQWDKALDLLIEARQEEKLPGLSEIYSALRNAVLFGVRGKIECIRLALFRAERKIVCNPRCE